MKIKLLERKYQELKYKLEKQYKWTLEDLREAYIQQKKINPALEPEDFSWGSLVLEMKKIEDLIKAAK